MTEPTERELLEQINGKLDRIMGILASQNREPDDMIRVLRSLGHDWEFIGTLSGLPPNTARMRHARSIGKKATPKSKKK